MKLHLPIALFAAVTMTMSYAAAYSNIVDENGELVTSIVKEYGTGATGSGYGVSNRENGAPIESVVHTIKDGADMKSVLGGIHIASGADGNNNHHNDQPLIDAGTDTVSIANGVTINVEGGKVGQIKGGNSISSGGEAAVAALGEKVNVGSIAINVTGGEIGMVDKPDEEAIMGGGGRWCGTADNAGIEVNISGGLIHNTVYAGTNGGSTGYTKLNITGGTIESNVYGAGRKDFGVVLGNTEVNVSGGKINGNVYAAGDQDTVMGDAVVTVSGNAQINGIVSGGGTNGSTVEGMSILNIGTQTALKIDNFDVLNVQTSAVLDELTTDNGGTQINIEYGASLSLNEVIITGQNNAVVLNGFKPDVNFGNAHFTIVLSNELMASGGSLTFDLVAADLQTMLFFDVDAIDKEDISFVLEDGTVFNPNPTDFDVASTLRSNVDMNNPGDDKHGIVVTLTVPEPTTATLSLLALSALAARRRRK